MSQRSAFVDAEARKIEEGWEISLYCQELDMPSQIVTLSDDEYRCARRRWRAWVSEAIQEQAGDGCRVIRRPVEHRVLIVAGVLLCAVAATAFLAGGIYFASGTNDVSAISRIQEERRLDEIKSFTREDVVSWFSAPRGASNAKLEVLFDLARQYEVSEAIPRAMARASREVPYDDERYASVLAARYFLTKFDDEAVNQAVEGTMSSSSLRDFLRWRNKSR